MGMVIFLQYVIVLTIISNMLHNTNLIKYKTCSEKKKAIWCVYFSYAKILVAYNPDLLQNVCYLI